tara:strand:+ start:531 stop:1673 length:1143 start_codon:yes stop_codon:yes gene_type:complete
MAYKYKLKEFEIGDVKVDNGTKSTVTDIDSTTGAISWSIQQIPNIDKLVEDVDELTATAKKVYQKAKDDKKFLDIYEQARSLRNVIRTHVRNNYPDDYKKAMRENMNEESSSVYKMIVDLILNAKSKYPVYYNTSRGWVNVGGTGYQGGDLVTIFKAKQGQSTGIKNVFYKAAQTPDETKKEVERLSKGKISVDLEGKGSSAILKYNLREEEEVEEMSTSGAAGGYLTPYAFRKKGAKADDEAYKELGYTVVKEDESQYPSFEVDKNIKYQDMNITKGYWSYTGKESGGRGVYLNVINQQMLGFNREDIEIFRKNLPNHFSIIDESAEQPGEDLGPGPKATEDGVKDSAYTKQFKYKLVPKNKDGTYVQKGSGMVVKKLN